MMHSQPTSAKPQTSSRRADGKQKQREAEVREFAQHMRTWWRAIDPVQADKVLKKMGIQA